MKKINILDCTLRDGGYINNWEFTEDTFNHVIKTYESIDIQAVEVGILGGKHGEAFSTRFPDFSAIPYFEKNKQDVLFAVMGTYGDLKKIEIPEQKKVSVNAIRLAFFKEDATESLKLAKEMMKKGYAVFLQAMATFMYTDEELSELVQNVNQLKPYAFYMVDSFGTMYPEEVEKMYKLIASKLNGEIIFGFHAHNNMQLAFANVMRFIEIADREVFVDASVYGMGRGAGNLNMELLLKYMNDNHGTQYNCDLVMDLFQSDIEEEYRKYGWGYGVPYYYASVEKVNAVYIWYLHNKGINDYKQIRKILKELPEGVRHTLNRDVVDALIEKSYAWEK